MKPTDVKQILDDILREVVSAPDSYVYHPQKNFSRTRIRISFCSTKK